MNVLLDALGKESGLWIVERRTKFKVWVCVILKFLEESRG